MLSQSQSCWHIQLTAVRTVLDITAVAMTTAHRIVLRNGILRLTPKETCTDRRRIEKNWLKTSSA